MQERGYQKRFTLDEEGAVVHQRLNRSRWRAKEVVLRDIETGRLTLWSKNDHYCGAVVVIDGVEYEFVRSVDPS